MAKRKHENAVTTVTADEARNILDGKNLNGYRNTAHHSIHSDAIDLTIAATSVPVRNDKETNPNPKLVPTACEGGVTNATLRKFARLDRTYYPPPFTTHEVNNNVNTVSTIHSLSPITHKICNNVNTDTDVDSTSASSTSIVREINNNNNTNTCAMRSIAVPSPFITHEIDDNMDTNTYTTIPFSPFIVREINNNTHAVGSTVPPPSVISEIYNTVTIGDTFHVFILPKFTNRGYIAETFPPNVLAEKHNMIVPLGLYKWITDATFTVDRANDVITHSSGKWDFQPHWSYVVFKISEVIAFSSNIFWSKERKYKVNLQLNMKTSSRTLCIRFFFENENEIITLLEWFTTLVKTNKI